MFCEHNVKAKKEGTCAKCSELKPYMQFKTCKAQCFNCKECGWFYGPGASEDKAGRPVPERERSVPTPYIDPNANFKIVYMAYSIKEALAPKYAGYLAKLTVGRSPNWNCDQPTKDNFCISNWMIDELISLGAEETDRHDTQQFFNRKARAETDLYEVAAKAMNNFIDGNIERYRRIERS